MHFLRFSCYVANIFNISYGSAENAEKQSIKLEGGLYGSCPAIDFLDEIN